MKTIKEISKRKDKDISSLYYASQRVIRVDNILHGNKLLIDDNPVSFTYMNKVYADRFRCKKFHIYFDYAYNRIDIYDYRNKYRFMKKRFEYFSQLFVYTTNHGMKVYTKDHNIQKILDLNEISVRE